MKNHGSQVSPALDGPRSCCSLVTQRLHSLYWARTRSSTSRSRRWTCWSSSAHGTGWTPRSRCGSQSGLTSSTACCRYGSRRGTRSGKDICRCGMTNTRAATPCSCPSTVPTRQVSSYSRQRRPQRLVFTWPLCSTWPSPGWACTVPAPPAFLSRGAMRCDYLRVLRVSCRMALLAACLHLHMGATAAAGGGSLRGEARPSARPCHRRCVRNAHP